MAIRRVARLSQLKESFDRLCNNQMKSRKNRDFLNMKRKTNLQSNLQVSLLRGAVLVWCLIVKKRKNIAILLLLILLALANWIHNKPMYVIMVIYIQIIDFFIGLCTFSKVLSSWSNANTKSIPDPLCWGEPEANLSHKLPYKARASGQSEPAILPLSFPVDLRRSKTMARCGHRKGCLRQTPRICNF